MIKWFFSSSTLLFLGNWIGQIALNWYVFELYHSAWYLALLNLCRLLPILFLSLWAGQLADTYERTHLIRLTTGLSFCLTMTFAFLSLQFAQISIIVILLYSLGRGVLSALETPVRHAILPDLKTTLTVTQRVSYHSLIINLCRALGPAITGVIIAMYEVEWAFIVQTLCYGLACMMLFPIRIQQQAHVSREKQSETWAYVATYFKNHVQSSKIVITSFIMMATGFSYTTFLPILTDVYFPGNAMVFGNAMTASAIGAMIATICIPYILKHITMVQLYYISSILFGIALFSVVIPNMMILFLSLFSIGLFSQCARTTNRIYFQTEVPCCYRGRVMSVVMMDRAMIPLGGLLMGVIADRFGIITTFSVMAMITMSVVLISVGLKNRDYKGEVQ